MVRILHVCLKKVVILCLIFVLSLRLCESWIAISIHRDTKSPRYQCHTLFTRELSSRGFDIAGESGETKECFCLLYSTKKWLSKHVNISRDFDQGFEPWRYQGEQEFIHVDGDEDVYGIQFRAISGMGGRTLLEINDTKTNDSRPAKSYRFDPGDLELTLICSPKMDDIQYELLIPTSTPTTTKLTTTTKTTTKATTFTSKPMPMQAGNKLMWIIGVVIAAFLIVLLLIIAICAMKKWKKKRSAQNATNSRRLSTADDVRFMNTGHVNTNYENGDENVTTEYAQVNLACLAPLAESKKGTVGELGDDDDDEKSPTYADLDLGQNATTGNTDDTKTPDLVQSKSEGKEKVTTCNEDEISQLYAKPIKKELRSKAEQSEKITTINEDEISQLYAKPIKKELRRKPTQNK